MSTARIVAPVLCAVCAAVTLAPSPAAAQAPPRYAYATQFGSVGADRGQFTSPWGIAATTNPPRVFVADTGNHRIQRFDTALANPFAWGHYGPAGTFNTFNYPEDVAVDDVGNVYVADTANSRIEKSTADGDGLWQKGGVIGAADGQFNNPRGVATFLDGVFVVDARNNRVQVLNRDTGAFLRKWGRNGGDGTSGTGPGEFAAPADIAICGTDQVYVSDETNHRIQRFDYGGLFISRWGVNNGDGTPGAGGGEFAFPDGIAVDHECNVYVAEPANNNRVQIFDKSGDVLGVVRGEGTPGGSFSPHDVAVAQVTANGRTFRRMFILDAEHDRIVVFDEVTGSGPPPPPPAGTPRDTSPPSPIIRKVIERRGALEFTYSCPAGEVSCDYAAVLRSVSRIRGSNAAPARLRRLVFGRRSGTVAGGAQEQVRIRFSKRSRRVLARRGRIAARLLVTSADAAGNRSATSRRLTLRAR
jgi:hypothetical protein